MNKPHETHPTVANLEARIKELEGCHNLTVQRAAAEMVIMQRYLSEAGLNATASIVNAASKTDTIAHSLSHGVTNYLDFARQLERELEAANKRADEAEKEAAMFKDAYYGSAPSGAKIRCRKCGNETEINFHYANQGKS